MSLWEVPCFVINCKKDVERREITEKRMIEAGFSVDKIHFFEASDGYHLSPSTFTEENIFLEGKGEKGVALSHKRIWKKIVEEKIERALIFEDDVTFHPEFKEYAPKLWEMTPSNAGLMFLGHCCFHLGGNQGRDSRIGTFEGMPLALHSYAISYKAATWFLEHFGEVRENIDLHMRKLYYDNLVGKGWGSYCWWNGDKVSPLQHQTRFNVYFNGFCYQDHDILLSIHRDRNK